MTKHPSIDAVLPAALVASVLGAANPLETAGIEPGPATVTDEAKGRSGVAVIVGEEVRSIRDDLAPLILAAQERFRIPGLSLILVRGNETLWAEGFGFADKASETPANASTIFRVGSLAKPFTAMAVMQMAEQGEIDIDQTLAGYLPELSIRSRFDTTAEPITVRSVLSHHSGIPTDLNKGMWSEEPFTGVAARLAEDYAAFPPNLVFSYSNVGYTLLGHLVEKTSGTPYGRYMEEHIFRPLGMTNTELITRPRHGKAVAKGYRDGKALTLLPIRDVPALGLHTSAADLGRFMGALLTGGGAGERQLLLPGTLEEMFEPQNAEVDLDLDVVVGLGWFLEEGSIVGAGPAIRHGGTTLAFSAELILLPEIGLGAAVLANADGSRAVVSRLAEEILTRVMRSNVEAASADLFIERLEKDQHSHRTGDAAGSYATDLGLISIRPKDAKLCACIVEETFDLIPYPDGWLGIDRRALGSLPAAMRPLGQMRFQTQVIEGREVVVAKKGEKQTVIGEKIPPEPVPEVWLQRVGKYELLNPDPQFPLTEPEVKVQDGHLCMSYKLPRLSSSTIQVPLRPISDTEAIILGLGRTRGETLRAITVDGVERLRYSGFEGRRIPDVREAPPSH
jgi:CubicO group peptidase (beta-lactamase class C family)